MNIQRGLQASSAAVIAHGLRPRLQMPASQAGIHVVCAEILVTTVLVLVHYPLPMHRFAESAARVSECAAERNQFEAMQNPLFKGQRDFGLKPWVEFATQAGISNLAAFEACIQREGPIARIVEAVAWETKLESGEHPH